MKIKKDLKKYKNSFIFFYETYKLDICEIVTKYKRDNNLTNKQLANKLKLSKRKIARLLDTNLNLSIKKLCKILHFIKRNK